MSQLVTGEAVVLQVRIARMPTRALACAIDVVIQGIVLAILFTTLFGFLLTSASDALRGAIIFFVLLLVLVGYRVVMETLTRGRTLGKLMLGLKVVRDDGSSIRFRHALVRTLLWLFVDFAPWFAASPGIVTSLMNKQGKRIGDLVAGTVVIRERHQPMASPPLFVPAHLVQWAHSLELSRLSDELANTAREYLARYTELEPGARIALGDALAFRVGGVTAPAPPVQLSSPAFLSAVLAERRRRELDRLATQGPRFVAYTGPFGTAYAPPSPTAYAPPSPYGALPPQPVPQGLPYPPQQPARGVPVSAPTKVNAQGWHAPGSEPDQWS
ncbi:RDD family protein [Kribbella monticola]|uniref:RDD family protein n=1 Tax=Kribbella monticola TaxID=2185285 RepID=UPI001E363B64|nr:RDD family protein [Kribbella monticola]